MAKSRAVVEEKLPEEFIDPPAPEDVAAPPVVAEPLSVGEVYARFVECVEGNFPAWDVLPAETRALYEANAQHVVNGNEPRTEFERLVARLIKPE